MRNQGQSLVRQVQKGRGAVTRPFHGATAVWLLGDRTNLPSLTVSISKASMPRPLWSWREKLKMPAVPTQALQFSMASRTLSLSAPAVSMALARIMKAS